MRRLHRKQRALFVHAATPVRTTLHAQAPTLVNKKAVNKYTIPTKFDPVKGAAARRIAAVSRPPRVAMCARSLSPARRRVSPCVAARCRLRAAACRALPCACRLRVRGRSPPEQVSFGLSSALW